MKQVLHILTKDLKRYAWAWISLAVIAVIEIYLHGSSAGLMDTDFNKSVSMISSFAGGLLLFILIVMVVQEESLADPDADWLSRPIHRGSLLVSKLAFVLIISMLFRISDCVVLLLNGGANRIPYALLEILAVVVAWFAQIFLAAQTRSLPRYLLFAVAIYVGLFVLSACSMFMAAGLFDTVSEMGQLPGNIPDHHFAWIQTIYWLCAGGGILYFLYQKRRILASWGLVLVAGFIALILTPNDGMGGPFETYFDSSGQERVELEKIQVGGSMQMNGVNYVELQGVFSIQDVPVGADIWTTIRGGTITRGGEEIDFEGRDMSQRMSKISDNQYTAAIGYVDAAEFRSSNEPINIQFMQEVAFSTQEPIGHMELRTGSSHVSEGNRLTVQSFYRSEGKISVQIGTHIPNFTFEPQVEVSPFEAFEGKYSFSLITDQGQFVDDFDLTNSFMFIMGSSGSGSISVELAENLKLEDYRIKVHARRITDTDSQFTSLNDVLVED